MNNVMFKSTNIQSVVNVAIDLGNRMLKGATEIEGKVSVVKLQNRTSIQGTLTEKVRCIELEGKKIYVGVGKLNNNSLKHTRHNLLEQALVIINELYQNVENLKVNLILGLPYSLYDDESCINELKSKFPTHKKLLHKIDGIDKTVEFNSVSVAVEGYSAFINIMDKIDIKQRVLICDVGGETIDLCAFKYDFIENEYNYEKAYTIKTGVIALTDEIATNINKTIGGADIEGCTVDDLLRANQKYVFYRGTDYLLSDYIETIEQTVEGIILEITNEYGALDNYHVIGVGGGYDVFNAIANKHIKANIDLSAEDRFYANVVGYLEQ